MSRAGYREAASGAAHDVCEECMVDCRILVALSRPIDCGGRDNARPCADPLPPSSAPRADSLVVEGTL